MINSPKYLQSANNDLCNYPLHQTMGEKYKNTILRYSIVSIVHSITSAVWLACPSINSPKGCAYRDYQMFSYYLFKDFQLYHPLSWHIRRNYYIIVIIKCKQ